MVWRYLAPGARGRGGSGVLTEAVFRDTEGGWRLSLKAGAAGRWGRLTVRARLDRRWWARVEVTDEARGQVVRSAFLGALWGDGETRSLLLHLPQSATELRLVLIAEGGAVLPVPEIGLRVLGRGEAALRLLWGGWRLLRSCVRGNPAGLPGRVRAQLGQAPARAGDVPGYRVWLDLYDRWEAGERAALAGWQRTGDVRVEVVICGAAAQASLEAPRAQALLAQWLVPERVSIAGPDFSRLPGAWLVVVGREERLAAQALACFAHVIAHDAGARAIYADMDLASAGVRSTPMFKPSPDPWLMAGMHLTRGACAFHPDVAWPVSADAADGDAIRHAMAMGVPAEGWRRIPFILTHAGAAPRPAASRDAVAAATPLVSMIVPSACRSWHVLKCLRRVLALTDYANFEILLAVSRVDASDARQESILFQARQLARVRVLDLGMAEFNYAAANNAAVLAAQGDLILLLNDDVVPISPDWLGRMVGLTLGRRFRAGVVGARLLYGNGQVQHGGVILGLANLCEHAFRLSERGDDGPYGIARATREVSAVTAACLLVDRAVWQRAGGLDERFAVALNDVDFCLRAGYEGARVVFAGGVELYHYESLSLGRHYKGVRAGLEAVEVRLLRERWQSAIADDPFYNPQASCLPGWEFQPGFPPRLTPLSWIGREAAENH